MPGAYTPLPGSGPPSPASSSRNLSNGSDTPDLDSSLRALELSDGPMKVEVDGEGANGPQRPVIGRHHRSSTLSSLAGFEFRSDLLPLTLSGEVEHDPTTTGHGEKHIRLIHGIALIIGIQIGSGIFAAPGVIVSEVGSIGASLIVWVACGVLSWTGAASQAELGAAIPLSGGPQAYLGYAYGPLASYLYAWSSIFVFKSAADAMPALICGEYLNRMIYHAVTGDPTAIVPAWTYKVTAIIIILLVTGLNLFSRSSGTNSSVAINVIKLASLGFVIVIGFVWLVAHGAEPEMRAGILFAGTTSAPSRYAIAFYSGMWAFAGWDACAFVAGEMVNPEKNIPLAVSLSMTTVIILYTGVNFAYLVVLDPATVASSNTVALDFGRVVIGRLGAVVFSSMVAISTFGSLVSTFYTTARLVHSAAKDHFLPDCFARIDPKRKTPDNAMFLYSGLVLAYLLVVGDFRRLLNFSGITITFFNLLTTAGVLVLRVKEPNLNRPYRVWLITPITFCTVSLFLVLLPVTAAPLEAFAALVFVLAGVPVYYLTAQWRVDGTAHPGPVGVKGAITLGWQRLKEDLADTLPSRLAARIAPDSRQRISARPVTETQGMLPLERLDMSER